MKFLANFKASEHRFIINVSDFLKYIWKPTIFECEQLQK